jgi:cystathionine beta-synthase
LMTSKGISQMPVTYNNEFVGSLVDSKLLALMIEDTSVKQKTVAEIMENPFQFVSPDNTLDVLSSVITKDNPAVMIRDKANEVHIITRHDLLHAMTSN